MPNVHHGSRASASFSTAKGIARWLPLPARALAASSGRPRVALVLAHQMWQVFIVHGQSIFTRFMQNADRFLPERASFPDALSSAKGRPSTAAPRGTSGTAMVFPSCNVAAAFLGRGEIGWVRRSGACVAAGALANGRPPDVAPPCRCLSTHCDGVHGRIPPCFARAPLAPSLLLPHAHGVFAAPGPCGALRLFGCEALLFFRCRALGRARLAHPLPLLVSTEPPGSGRFLCVYSPSFPW